MWMDFTFYLFIYFWLHILDVVIIVSYTVVSDSVPHAELQHTRPPCPSATPGTYSNLCPLSQWWHPAISCSVVPFCFNLSQHQGLFKWVSSLYQVAKCWSFSFSISPYNEYSGLISFMIDCFDLLAVQGTLKSLLQHCGPSHQFFSVQLSL